MSLRLVDGDPGGDPQGEPSDSPGRACDFDPIAVGARHQLTREVALAIWDYVGHQLAGYGARNPALTRECFQEVAARVAARGVWPLPDARRPSR